MLPPRCHTSPKPWGQQLGRFPAPPVPERLAALEGRVPVPPQAPHGAGSPVRAGPGGRELAREQPLGLSAEGAAGQRGASVGSPACQPPAPCPPAPCTLPSPAWSPLPPASPCPSASTHLARYPRGGSGGSRPSPARPAQGARVPAGARTEARSRECPPPPPQRHAHPPPPRGRSVAQRSEPLRAEPCRAQAVPARTGPRRSRPFMEGGPELGPGGAERRGPRPARPPKGLFPPAALRGKHGRKAAPRALPAGAPPGLPRGRTACSGSGMGVKPEGAGHPGTAAAGFATETSVRG
ncbi:basic proline-rich protein-like [Passer montanus]|uniref:basic proline-rich protein-like n=1 Tax=Passer montanus TaxID=9160 RepID=UPI001960E627|nr:basic proline-rich protein-like [Passer montanus]